MTSKKDELQTTQQLRYMKINAGKIKCSNFKK